MATFCVLVVAKQPHPLDHETYITPLTELHHKGKYLLTPGSTSGTLAPARVPKYE